MSWIISMGAVFGCESHQRKNREIETGDMQILVMGFRAT